MSWIVESSLTFFQKFCVNVIKCGPVPKHIAFIMDGNRRFAKKTNVERIEGHSKGFDKLAECLQWCLELGVKEVTVYAFSIENFKRSQDEVDKLMDLATKKFAKLLEEKDKLMQEGICVRVVGNFSLLSPELRKYIAEIILLTRHNKNAILNVAFAYTSSEEITTAIKCILDGVENNLLQIDDINEDLISNCLYTNQSSNPDILVRTSGEVRLSDYLLWQIIENTTIYFKTVLWPEFSIWHLLACIFQYQRTYIPKDCKKQQHNVRVGKFLDHLQEIRYKNLEYFT